MENKIITIIHYVSKPQLIRDVPVFVKFVNFYQQLIQRFSQIAALLTPIVKILGNKPLACNQKLTSKGAVINNIDRDNNICGA